MVAAFHLPYDRGDLVGYLHDRGQVLEEHYTNQGIHMKVIMPRILANRLAEYMVAGGIREVVTWARGKISGRFCLFDSRRP